MIRQKRCREQARSFRRGLYRALCLRAVDAPHLDHAEQQGRAGRAVTPAAACSRASKTVPACTAMESQRSTQAFRSALNFGVETQL